MVRFRIFKSQCILINVLDVTAKTKTQDLTQKTITDGKINLGQGFLIANGVNFESGKNYKSGTDYVIAYDEDGNAILTVIRGNAMSSLTTVKIGYSYVDINMIANSDILSVVLM